MQWTDQIAFEYATKKVIEQGGPSRNGNGGCLYDDGNGNKCHVGHLLGAEYNRGFEGEPIENLKIKSFKLLDMEILRSCQIAHDDVSRFPDFIKAYKKKIKDVAEKYGLDANFLDEVKTTVDVREKADAELNSN